MSETGKAAIPPEYAAFKSLLRQVVKQETKPKPASAPASSDKG